MEQRKIDLYITTGSDFHHPSWRGRFAEVPKPPAADAALKVKVTYKLRTEIGQAIYKLRKSTVEPVIGIIKEVIGFQQFSLRSLQLPRANGDWLVCLVFNLKQMHILPAGQL